MECVVTRPDGTTCISRRTPKLEITLENGTVKPCTSLAHCAAVLNDHLQGVVDRPITVNHLHRRSAWLLRTLENQRIRLAYCAKPRITPIPVSPTPQTSPVETAERFRWFTDSTEEPQEPQ